MIDRERIKAIVIKAINQLPTEAILVRGQENTYHVIYEYKKVSKLTGVLYTDDNISKNISYSDSGVSFNYPSKKFITVYNADIKEGDLLITDKVYQVIFPGENMKIYNEVILKETDYTYENGVINGCEVIE